MSRRIQLAVAILAAVPLLLAAEPAIRAVAKSRDRQAVTPHTPIAPDIENLSAAVCPVVYQLDDAPGTRGYHYIFYGNAFFINREGYLLTAAHVLSEFRNGGQPSILVRLASAPPRLLKIEVIATDLEHDVAILRVSPNPFRGPYAVATLPLGEEKPAIGEGVAATALRPGRLKDPHTFELPIADTYLATVLDYRSMALNPNPQASGSLVAAPAKGLAAQTKSSPLQPSYDEPAASGPSIPQSLGQPQIQTDLFLFSHEVQRGQSGAPVTSVTNHKVVGIIEGRWLHPAASKLIKPAKDSAPSHSVPPPLALTQGAAIPISYAIALLQKNHVHWDAPPAKTISAPSNSM